MTTELQFSKFSTHILREFILEKTYYCVTLVLLHVGKEPLFKSIVLRLIRTDLNYKLKNKIKISYFPKNTITFNVIFLVTK